ncbi:DUF6266 family protein [Pedobacter sp. MC2016-24]|uniref:DUF6266 family protein n=1 Tax=Pedobacter sp. MC2016-24 TaxID=2780090 RepID=UPI00187EC416|nr:DUF6266 family protein [Pedobacter sp. MC2016-24]MBE9599005.1 hypothetical protein [Pedobacter sp. MC2016-24]
MGILLGGLNGPFKGRIGDIVCYLTKSGKNVTQRVGVNNVPPSELQLRNRIVTKLSGEFFCCVKDFIETGFSTEAALMKDNAYNMAVKNNKKQMVTGAYPNLELNYSQILLSKGLLKPATDWQVSQTTMGLHFSWETDPKMAWPESVEQAMLLAYFPEEKRSEYVLFGSARSFGTSELEIPPSLQGKYMETYLSFIAADRKQVANSIYTGSFNKTQENDHLLLIS